MATWNTATTTTLLFISQRLLWLLLLLDNIVIVRLGCSHILAYGLHGLRLLLGLIQSFIIVPTEICIWIATSQIGRIQRSLLLVSVTIIIFQTQFSSLPEAILWMNFLRQTFFVVMSNLLIKLDLVFWSTFYTSFHHLKVTQWLLATQLTFAIFV